MCTSCPTSLLTDNPGLMCVWTQCISSCCATAWRVVGRKRWKSACRCHGHDTAEHTRVRGSYIDSYEHACECVHVPSGPTVFVACSRNLSRSSRQHTKTSRLQKSITMLAVTNCTSAGDSLGRCSPCALEQQQQLLVDLASQAQAELSC